ncbi:hypothetical protein D3C80_1887720 [compost metagenome]
MDDYINKILGEIDKSELSEPLKSQVKSQIDIIDYKGLSTIRIRIPKQSEISFIGKQSYIRENSKTLEMDAPKLLAISKMFK